MWCIVITCWCHGTEPFDKVYGPFKTEEMALAIKKKYFPNTSKAYEYGIIEDSQECCHGFIVEMSSNPDGLVKELEPFIISS